MPRTARLAFSNAFYHVFNRGINKQTIFLTENDYSFFLRKLLQLKKKYDFSLYAYCLMPNHFHLSIHTRHDSISKIIASLATSYSMYFNHKYSHFGPVFQNRFKSVLVQSDSYFLQLARYIYLNPVKALLVKNPLDWPYSSFAEAVDNQPFVFLDEDFTRLIGDKRQAKEKFQTFVMDGLRSDLSEIEELFESDKDILGSSRFATEKKKIYKL